MALIIVLISNIMRLAHNIKNIPRNNLSEELLGCFYNEYVSFFHQKFDGDVHFVSRWYFWYVFSDFLHTALKLHFKHAHKIRIFEKCNIFTKSVDLQLQQQRCDHHMTSSYDIIIWWYHMIVMLQLSLLYYLLMLCTLLII